MKNTWADFWNERYSNREYVYGEAPNDYLKNQLVKLVPGSILLPAEGEGRNAVFAASRGWQVSAFDISAEGQKKARQLAEKNRVTIDYRVGELPALDYENETFDAVALIYAHFPADVKADICRSLDKLLRSGGTVIFEAFSKKHLEYAARNEKIGGPRDMDMLYSMEEISSYFSNYEVIELEETEADLEEGLFHRGTGSVVRFVGKKR